MTKKLEFTKAALKQIERIILTINQKNTLGFLLKVVVVQDLNITFRLMTKLTKTILFLIKL